MSYFTYNGRSSADFGLHIEKKDVFSAPEYDAEFISIPGRSGDIINPNRRFSNIKVTYTVFLARKNVAALASNLRDIKGWLYSEPDRYHELTDSYDAEYFRYGVISGNLDIEEQLNKIGCFTVTFNCKPFKYSFAGQHWQPGIHGSAWKYCCSLIGAAPTPYYKAGEGLIKHDYDKVLWKCARTSSSDTQPSSSPERMPVLSSHIRRSIAFAFSNSSSSAISRIVKRPRPLTVRYTGEPAETCSRTVL